MFSKIRNAGILLLSLLSLFVPSSAVFATDVNVSTSQTCNVPVIFRATVPDSIEQGKSFTMTNISIQPTSTYGFTVTSSIFTMAATNTSSTAYRQNFSRTNPSPTTGASTYLSYYPDWSLDATGAVGDSVTIQLKSTVTVVQGFGNVSCPFSNILARIPITAPPPPPSPPPTHSTTHHTTHSTSPSPSSSPKSSTKPSSSPKTTKPKPTSKSTPSPSATPTVGSKQDDTGAVTVVPLNIEVKDNSGKAVKGATVTLDGSQKTTTSAKGRATFSNVLTGAHALLVSYKGRNISRNIQLDTANIGKVVSVGLPSTSPSLNLMIISGITATVILLGGVAAWILLRQRMASEIGEAPAISLHGIISGSAIEKPTNLAMAHVPAVSMFTARPAAVTPAPWDLASAQSFPKPAIPVQPKPQVAQPGPQATHVKIPITRFAPTQPTLVTAAALPVPVAPPVQQPAVQVKAPAAPPPVAVPPTPAAPAVIPSPAPIAPPPQPAPVIPPAPTVVSVVLPSSNVATPPAPGMGANPAQKPA